MKNEEIKEEDKKIIKKVSKEENNKKESKDDNYRPKLFINTKLVSDKKLQNDFYKEVDEGSITPRTFKSRESDKKDSKWFIDKYSFGNSKALRYGIDYNKIDIDFKNSKILSEKHGLLDLETDTLSSLSTSLASTNNSSKKKKTPIQIKFLPLEIDLITKAVDYLLNNKEQSNAVGVDIIARHKGDIKILKSKEGTYYPETHSVVLYKNPVHKKTGKHEILVIDPSNFKYSSSLNQLSKVIEKTLLSPKLFDKITTYDKGIQIYNPGKDKTGFGKDKSRDCIDITAKLIFSLAIKKDSINLKKIKNLDEVKMISNNFGIDSLISKKNSNIKVKQSSDINVVESFYGFEKLISNLTKFAENCDDKLSNNLIGDYSKILKNYGHSKIVIKELGKLYYLYGEELLKHQKNTVNLLIEKTFVSDILGNTNENLEE